MEAATKKQIEAVEADLRDAACAPFDDAGLRNLVKAIKKKTDIVIDEGTTDEVVSVGYDLKQAQQRVTSFREFIETHKDELLALQILYSRPFPKRRLTYASIRQLAQVLDELLATSAAD